MRTYLLISSLLICTASLVSQSSLPQMKVWYDIPNAQYGGKMFYLPNFDTTRGGFNAVSMWRSGFKNRTLYNRFIGDTNDLFTWNDEISELRAGDFNADGIVDYCGNGGYMVYQGIQTGSPPNPISVASYPVPAGALPSIINDFNGDHFDDILLRSRTTPTNSYDLGRLLLGGADLTHMKTIVFPRTNLASSHWECIIDAYHKKDGSMRMITASYTKIGFEAASDPKLEIWQVSFVGSADSQSVEYKLLTSITASVTSASTVAENVSFFHSIDNSTHALSIGSPTPTKYITTNDNFDFVTTGSFAKEITYLPKSNTYEWYQTDWDLSSDTVNIDGVICRGDPLGFYVKVMRFRGYTWIKPSTYIGSLSNVLRIGDINNDGIGDYLVLYGVYSKEDPTSRLVFYLGSDGSDIVKHEDPSKLSVDFIVPNPVRDRKAVKCNIIGAFRKFANIDLYGLDGKFIGHLWQGTIESDKEDLLLNISELKLSQGWFNLRFTCGNSLIDKSLIIE